MSSGGYGCDDVGVGDSVFYVGLVVVVGITNRLIDCQLVTIMFVRVWLVFLHQQVRKRLLIGGKMSLTALDIICNN